MTEKRLLEFAYQGALEIWGKIYDKLNEDKDNKYLIEQEKKAWQELKEIEKLENEYKKRCAVLPSRYWEQGIEEA